MPKCPRCHKIMRKKKIIVSFKLSEQEWRNFEAGKFDAVPAGKENPQLAKYLKSIKKKRKLRSMS